MSTTAPAIRVRGLRKHYPGRDGGVTAVDGLDLDVAVGEVFGLLGPNGAGKTTTVEILEGIGQPTSGEVEILGRRWEAEPTAIAERIGVTLQETRFQEKSTVLELAELFRSFYRRGAEPMEALRKVSLEGKANAYVETLSGGQRQRLAVAIALVGDPELLFLDEPTTGLDPQSRRQLQEVILGLRDQDRTILLTTHYMDEAERLCDRVAIVDRGVIIALGSPAELIAGLPGSHVVEFSVLGDDRPTPEVFEGLDEVQSVRAEGDGFALTVGAAHRAIPALLERVESTGRTLGRLTTRQASLEDVFVALTGRSLRDDEASEVAPEKGRRGRRGRAPARS